MTDAEVLRDAAEALQERSRFMHSKMVSGPNAYPWDNCSGEVCATDRERVAALRRLADIKDSHA